MHNPDFMLQLLVNLALHYPQAGRTPAQLQILAEDWAEDLAEFSPGTVEKSVKRYRRESPYFPTVAKLSFFPVPADVMRQVEESRKRTPAVNREALPENALTLDERCELGTDWCAKILANLRCKMDARRQGRPDTPLDEQLANLRALGVEQ